MGETSRRLLLCPRSHPSLFSRNVGLCPYKVSKPGRVSQHAQPHHVGLSTKDHTRKVDPEFHTWTNIFPSLLFSPHRWLTLPLLQSEAAQGRMRKIKDDPISATPTH